MLTQLRLICASAAVVIATALAAPPLLAQTHIIHAGKLLATPGEAVQNQRSVVVVDGKVREIREGYITAQSAGLSGVPVIDLRNHFVMPGFMDLHVHLSGDRESSTPGDQYRLSDAHISLRASMNAKKTLMIGFTTVRDLGSKGDTIFALRDAVKAGWVPGPRILASGNSISPTGGHGDINGVRREIMNAMPSPGACNGPSDCRRAVRQMIKYGADVIKVTATGGTLSVTGTGTGQQFTQEELNAIAETAHMFKRKVTAHAHGKEGIIAAIKAGFDNIEHSMWADEETMKVYKKHGTWMVPTVWPITYVGVTEEEKRAGPLKHVPPVVMEKLIALGDQPKTMTRLAHKMGVNIALGTDSGVSPHGTNANEFLEYVAIGMTPMEALMTGTVNAAKAAGIDHFTGKLVPGFAADIVAMPNDPLDDIKAVLGVDFVMRDGIVFKTPQ